MRKGFILLHVSNLPVLKFRFSCSCIRGQWFSTKTVPGRPVGPGDAKKPIFKSGLTAPCSACSSERNSECERMPSLLETAYPVSSYLQLPSLRRMWNFPGTIPPSSKFSFIPKVYVKRFSTFHWSCSSLFFPKKYCVACKKSTLKV